MSSGALDAWIAPATMKKGRPGHLLGALVEGGRRVALAELILKETPTLGVRAFRVERSTLERRFETVQTKWGPAKVKVGSLLGNDLHAAPEYEDCARIAREAGVPLQEVLAAAMAALDAKKAGR